VKASLVLQDGTVFEGSAFGARGRAAGTAVFYTGVVGYQEVVTDPAYRGALVALTYPMIGSYGVNPDDNQSDRVQAAGVVIRDYCPHYSNFRATGSFEEFLQERNVVGIRGVDTRALAVHLRENGEMPAAIVPGDFEVKKVVAELKKGPAPQPVSGAEAVLRIYSGPRGRKIAVLEDGAPAEILAQVRDVGFKPGGAVSDLEAAFAAGAAALLAVGAGGDPHEHRDAACLIEAALGKAPVLGIGLGHEILALALGCTVSRMKVGHHGLNHSVRDAEAGRCIITAQHHGFVVDPDVPEGVVVTHTNVNDGTVEGIRSTKLSARGVQFRPARDEMGAPSAILRNFPEGQDA